MMDPALPPDFNESLQSNAKLNQGSDGNDPFKDLPAWMRFLIKAGLVIIAFVLIILGFLGFFANAITLSIGGVFACIFLM